MTYDRHVPAELRKVQAWFSGIITQPIDKKSHIRPISPSGKPIAEEAKDFIYPSPTLEPSERIEIYNQQYWWRLLNTLHDTFPLATRLLGFHKFNEEIATPYLVAYPSEHWSLVHLGDRLPLWLKENYKGDDKEILLDSLSIDEAFNQCFFAAHLPPITANRKPEEVLTVAAQLQPHIFLFNLDYDLFRFRNEIKQKDPDFWSSHHYPNLKHALSENEHHFPKLQKGEHYFIIYRSTRNEVLWDDLNEHEYTLLMQFQQGTTIEKCCQSLEHGDKVRLEASHAHLKDWIQKWIANEWLINFDVNALKKRD